MGNEIGRRTSYSSCDDSSLPRIMNNSDPLTFHAVHGEHILLSKNNTVATRIEGFAQGIVFSSRAIAVNERIYVKFLDISTGWSGALRVGFTSNDPVVFRNRLPKYACPFLTDLPGNWARALSERLVRKDSVLFYYVDQNGDVHYGFDHEERGIFFGRVNTMTRLWALLDIYGNTVQVELVDPRQARRQTPKDHMHSTDVIRRNSCSTASTIHELSLRFPMMNCSSLIYFHEKHRQSTVLSRNSRRVSNGGFIFTNRPLELEEIIIIQVSQVDAPPGSTFVFGVTSCSPSEIESEDLPRDPDDLLDRSEYWVVSHATDLPMITGDFLAFVIRGDGALRFHRRGRDQTLVAYVDDTLPLWFFMEVLGSTVELTLTGAYRGLNDNEVSNFITILEANPTSTFTVCENELLVLSDLTLNETSNECVICYEAAKDCAIYRCGHACMCYECAIQLWHSSNPHCPLCRERIIDVIRIYK